MKSVLTTYDPVQLDYAATLLKEAGIETLVLDGSLHVYEALMWPAKRLMVLADEEVDAAAQILDEGLKAYAAAAVDEEG